MDTLGSMRAFLRVVQAGGFSKAAARLDISPAMVTKHVNSLEERLGVRLLYRTTRQVSLTEAGAAYYEHCARIVADLDDAEAAVGALSRAPRGTLRITAGVDIGEELAPLVTEFMRAEPEVAPEVVLENRFVDLVEERFDVGIRGAVRLPESSLIVRPLARSRLLLCAAPAYLEAHGTPCTPDDLERHRFLPIMHPLLREELLLRRDGEKRLVHIRPAMRSNSTRVLREASVAGAGILLLTTINAWHEVVAGRLTTVLEDWHTVDLGLYAVFPHRRHLAAKVRTFVDFLAERLGGDATRDPWWERIAAHRVAPTGKQHDARRAGAG
ncbi:MAG: LysR substrate-binding domain-containing protein [Bacteroidota bacterium]